MSRRFILVPAVVSFAVAGIAGAANPSSQSIAVAPYAAVVEARDADGSLVGLRSVFVSADGSVAEVRNPGALHSILDTRNLVEIALDDDTLLYVKSPMSPARAEGLKRVPGDCATHYSARGAMPVVCSDGGRMLGYRVVKSEVTLSRNGSVFVKRRYAVKELGWLPLLEEDVIDGKVSRTRRTIELRMGEPPSQRFVLPAKYKKATLEEFWEARHKHEGEPMKDEERLGLRSKMKKWEAAAAASGNTKWKE